MSKDKADDLRPEYTGELIQSGVRGKYASQYRGGTNLVLIDPDLTEHFPDSETVNRALRDHLRRKSRSAT